MLNNFPGSDLLLSVLFSQNIDVPTDVGSTRMRVDSLTGMHGQKSLQLNGHDDTTRYSGVYYLESQHAIWSSKFSEPYKMNKSGGDNSFEIESLDRINLAKSFLNRSYLDFMKTDGTESLNARVICVGYANMKDLQSTGDLFIIIKSNHGICFYGLWKSNVMILTPGYRER